MNSQRFPKLLLWLTFMLISVIVSAQERTVTGRVTDQQTGNPMQGVNVTVKGTSTGATTNANGEFTIRVPSADAILVFSNVGYLPFETKVGTTTAFTVPLMIQEKSLEDVVVVGYGTKKRVNVQGAVSSIKATEIEDIPVANLPSASWRIGKIAPVLAIVESIPVAASGVMATSCAPFAVISCSESCRPFNCLLQ